MRETQVSIHEEKLYEYVILTGTQIKKGILILVCFLGMRLVVARLWEHWFDMEYELSLPFLSFLLSTFMLMSVGLVYLGFTRWVGIDLKSWWFKPGRIKGDIKWGFGTIILGVALIFGIGIVLLLLNITPPTITAAKESDVPLAQTLAQIPVDLLLGWFFGFGIAAFQEETIFRGFMQGELSRRYGEWTGIVLQAFIFSFSHLGMTPLASIGDEVFSLLFRFGSGLLFGWLRVRRGTLLPAGIVHGLIG
jgi:membrane protease YdiL (CAAX protease family)